MLRTDIIWIILFILILCLEIFLSHQDGYKSGEESEVLAKILHISNKHIRILAHIVLFAVIMFVGLKAFKDYKMVITVAVSIWAILDEVTKPLMKNYRHMSIFDIGMNILGVVIGFGLNMV